METSIQTKVILTSIDLELKALLQKDLEAFKLQKLRNEDINQGSTKQAA